VRGYYHGHSLCDLLSWGARRRDGALSTHCVSVTMTAWHLRTQMETEEVKGGWAAQLQRFLSVILTSYGEGHTYGFDVSWVHASETPPRC
jgi:hypothetical protein